MSDPSPGSASPRHLLPQGERERIRRTFPSPLEGEGAEARTRRAEADEGSAEARERQSVCAIARTWLRTPFRDQGKVKGPNGAVDCAMLLVAVFQEAGLLDAAYDPRPYPPQFHLHHGEERFLMQIEAIVALRGCGAEIPNEPGLPAEALAKAGDVIVYRVGRCFSHGGLVTETPRSCSEAVAHKELQLLHAYYKTGQVSLSGLNEIELVSLPDGRPRPRKIFDLWAR